MFFQPYPFNIKFLIRNLVQKKCHFKEAFINSDYKFFSQFIKTLTIDEIKISDPKMPKFFFILNRI